MPSQNILFIESMAAVEIYSCESHGEIDDVAWIYLCEVQRDSHLLNLKQKKRDDERCDEL